LNMKIGIPREIKVLEGRVALTPAATHELVKQRHDVYIESGAGALSGYSDQEYQDAGVILCGSAEILYASAEIIVKVKEPQAAELKYLRGDHILFSYLHLAAEPRLTQELLDIGLTAVGFETVSKNNHLPLLAPMSDIAGRIAVQIGTHLLHQPQGGRGILLGGVTGTDKGHVVILGGGTAGFAAAQVASALGAQVHVFDPDHEKQQHLEAIGQNVSTSQPFAQDIDSAIRLADLLIGAVLIPGAKAPHLVSAEQVKTMKPGSVIIDISVDQGGCIDTTRPTTYEDPTFVWEEVIHFGVTNMPGAVPRTSTQALSAALLPFVLQLCEPKWHQNSALASGLNVENGKIILQTLI
jgi:alanine dehydrogenase